MNYTKSSIIVAFCFALGFTQQSLQAQAPPISEQPSRVTQSAGALECSRPECPIAIRDDATITVADLGAKLVALDVKQRDILLSDPNSLNGVIENLLLTRQLANEADRAALANDPIAQARLKQAEDEVYAVLRLDQIRAERITGDFERLAKEHFLTNKAAYTQPREQVVRHILIDMTARTDEQARAEATRLQAQLRGSSKDAFAKAAMDNSDDASKRTNGGMFTVAEGDPAYDPAFVAASMLLKTPGDITEPVKSQFGYHLIQLLSSNPAKTLPYEDAKKMIIERVAQDARRRVVSEYRGELTTHELKIYPENARAMIMDPDLALKQIPGSAAAPEPNGK